MLINELQKKINYKFKDISLLKEALIHSSYVPENSQKNIKNYDVFLNGGTITSKGESTIIEIENEKIKIIRKGALKAEDIMI